VRVAPGRDTGVSGSGLNNELDTFEQNSEIRGMSVLTGVIDSAENIYNAYRNMRTTLPRDVVWLVHNSLGTEEVEFDDYMDPKALIVSSMTAGAEFINADPNNRDYHNHWIYRDGYLHPGDGVARTRNSSVLVQNAATSDTLPIPRYGYLSAGRVEPIAMGGIHGRGLWLSGTNTVNYKFTGAMADTELFLSIFLDNRSGDESFRQLVRFPDGTQILLNGSTVRFKKLAEVRDVSVPTGKNNWNNLGIGVSQDHKTISIYHNGMKLNTISTNARFFRITDSLQLSVGSTENTGFRGWVDDLRLFSYIPTSEVICNHAYGSLHLVKDNATSYWKGVAARYSDETHREIFNQLPNSYVGEIGASSSSRFACTADYGDHMGKYRARQRESEGLISIRDAILFAVPVNGGFEDGRLHWNSARVDYRGNLFCLSCHTPAERRGLTLAALEPGPVCAMRDSRRQPFEPLLFLQGHSNDSQLRAIAPNHASLTKMTEPGSGALYVDPLVMDTLSGGSCEGTVDPAPTISVLSPGNDSTSNTNPIIRWASNGRVDFYYVDVSTNPQFTSYWNRRVNLPNLEVIYDGASGGWGTVGAGDAPANLSADKTYYIRAAAFYQGGSKLVHSSTVKIIVKAAGQSESVAMTSPTNNGSAKANPVLKWKASGPIDGFRVEVSTTSDFQNNWNKPASAADRQITFDGVQYPMEFPFLVIATQNPIEQEGTYSLPEAQ
jgi:hypothetical protein